MALQLSTGFRNYINDSGTGTAFDSGAVEIRSATRPAAADTAPTGTVGATIALPADAFGASASGTISKLGTWEDTSADATITATWFRMRTAGDAGTTNTTDRRLDGDVGTSGTDMIINNTSIASGQPVTITAASLTMPAS